MDNTAEGLQIQKSSKLDLARAAMKPVYTLYVGVAKKAEFEALEALVKEIYPAFAPVHLANKCDFVSASYEASGSAILICGDYLKNGEVFQLVGAMKSLKNSLPVAVICKNSADYVLAMEARADDCVAANASVERFADTLGRLHKAVKEPSDAFGFSRRVPIDSLGVLHHVAAEDISLVRWTSNKRTALDVYTCNGVILWQTTLKQAAKMLAPLGFVQISRSLIINVSQVLEIAPMSAMRIKIKVAGFTEWFEVSRRRAKAIASVMASTGIFGPESFFEKGSGGSPTLGIEAASKIATQAYIGKLVVEKAQV